MSATSDWLEAHWYGGQSPGFGLRAMASSYAAATGLRRAAYRSGWLRVQRVAAPVIVVGNITVGGSGKTPLVVAIVEFLRSQGWKPGVVSRGYGRGSRGQVVVEATTSAQDAGDEPLLIARRCGVPVVVDADRVAAARRVVVLGCDIVVADDGLQHYRLHRDIEIEVIDGDRGYGNRLLLPAGPLREPVARSALCDLHVVNGGSGEAGQWPMRLSGDLLEGANGASCPLDEFRGKRVHAIAGIGHPQRFFDRLRAQGLDVIEHAFADHHAYSAQDLDFNDGLPIVMTEKDSVKCAAFAPRDCWMLPVRAELDDGFFSALQRLLPQRKDAWA